MRAVLFVFLILAAQSLHAQTISGVVRESETGLPLPFANVFVNNTTQGIATDAEGKFSISGDFPSEIELVASFVGYVTEVKMISFGGKNQVEVVFNLALMNPISRKSSLKPGEISLGSGILENLKMFF